MNKIEVPIVIFNRHLDKVAALIVENASLREQLANKEDVATRCVLKTETSRQASDELEREVNQLRTCLELERSNIRVMSEQIAKAHGKADIAEEEASRWRKKYEQVSLTLKKLSENFEEKCKELRNAYDKIEHLDSLLDDKHQSITQLQVQLSANAGTIRELREELKEVRQNQ